MPGEITYSNLIRNTVLSEYISIDDTGLSSLCNIAHPCGQDSITVIRPTVLREETDQALWFDISEVIGYQWKDLTENAGIVTSLSPAES